MTKAVRTRLFFAIATVVASIASLNVPAALGAPGDIANLGTLGGASSRGLAINDAGQVTGNAQTTSGLHRAFRYSGIPGDGGAMADLGALGGSSSAGYAINDAGQVAGTSLMFGAPRAFLYSGMPGAGGAMIDLGTLGGDRSYGYAVNNAGQVVGHSTTDSRFFRDRAFLYSGTPGAGGAMASLGTLGGPDSYAWAINDAGQITGEAGGPVNASDGYYELHAFRYSGTPGVDGTMVDLGTLGGIRSTGLAINEAGQVAGWSDTTGNAAEHAFRYTGTPGAGGAMTDLGTLGGSRSHGFAINDAGFVVGIADRSTGAGGGSWATLWLTDADNTAVDLDAWLDAANPALGAYWTLSTASGINNRGLITGWGDYDDGAGGLSDGTRAFILDASSLVPEPTTLALLSLGLPLLGCRRRSRCLPLT